MRQLLGGLLFLILLAMVAAAAAITLWGVWGLLGVLVVAVLGFFLLKNLSGKLLEMAFSLPFRAKGAVLKGAATSVHSVTPAPAPKYEADEEDEELVNRALSWYHVDLTITPRPPSGRGFTLWEPSELVLVPPDTRSTAGMSGLSDEDEAVVIREVRLWRDGGWVEDEEGKYVGEQRVRLLVGAPSGSRRARLRYYFEVFGDPIELG